MPLFMSISCLLNTTAIVTVHTQAPQHHHSQMMAGYQGWVPVQLFWTPQSLQSAKQWESDHGTKYGVLDEIHPVLNMTFVCSNCLLPVSNFGSSSSCKQQWHSLDGLEHVWCCICVGRQQLLNLTNRAACNFATVNMQWTTPGLQKVHFILLYDGQQVHRPHLLLPRTSDTAILGKVT